ncbi:MAG: cardiolipin synthase [Crocinitomicaceae bacterium]|nr:cardiolipin synthase [Crocinitomicaceae bacterium]
MNWILWLEILYVVLTVFVCLWIIYETDTTTKTLAYLLLAIFVPILGTVFYFAFGVNYRKRKIYSKKLHQNLEMSARIKRQIVQHSLAMINGDSEIDVQEKQLMYLLLNDTQSPVSNRNEVKVLLNGEEKFPEVIAALKAAKKHIHMEYYIYENDEIGREIEEILIQKVKEGVEVRFIYDDFGSRSIRKNIVKRLLANGVQAFPFMKVYFILFANQVNYRNHRKIIVIDGITAFVGGINISDRYINKEGNKDKSKYWRDMHLRIDGPSVYYLQHVFLCDWNFCANEKIEPNLSFFPKECLVNKYGNKWVQIAASGPDSTTPIILYSLVKAISLAKREVIITTPYFIPGESLIESIVIAALSGVEVHILVPANSDTLFVNSAARSYYRELLRAGVRIYEYQKGFVHTKSMVVDGEIAIVGTANMDIRSFDLNFEVNAIVYDAEIAKQVRDAFLEDVENSNEIQFAAWKKRPFLRKLLEKIARLLSPML